MRPTSASHEIYLAKTWPLSKVRLLVRTRNKRMLIKFMRDRFQERYFEPIRSLRRAAGKKKHYGFAMMSLCSLLVEALQCYRNGLPFTDKGRLKKLGDRKLYPKVPKRYYVRKPEYRNGLEVFRCFFCDNHEFFPRVDGDTFYRHIRNGLLHQAQTTGGWRIKTKQGVLWNPDSQILDRDKFASQLEKCFTAYLEELGRAKRNQRIFENVVRKTWWLTYLSEDP